MALNGTIFGSFSGLASHNARPYFVWTAVQNIVDNYSDITIELYYEKIDPADWAVNENTSGGFVPDSNISINNNPAVATTTFDLLNNTLQLVRSRTVRVFHNEDGTKTVALAVGGDTKVYYGTFSFGVTVILDAIPREAYITNLVDFEVENDIPLTMVNGGNNYILAELYVNSVLIKAYQLGQVTAATLTLDGTDDDNIYAEMPNATSIAMFVRLNTFIDAGYSTQVGGDKDQAGTASVNQITNKPIFTTYTMRNVDWDIEVRDKYDNLLTTSSTETLLGGQDAMIKSYSKVRALIILANKMIAQNSATGSVYRFANAAKQTQTAYNDVAGVSVDLDNTLTNEFVITAVDSRGLTTPVANSLPYFADYFDISAFGIELNRDNNVDAATKLSFSGSLFFEYFGGGTTGTQNTLTVHYRFKETTVAWAAQTWNSITVTAASSFSFNDYVDGDLGAAGFDTDKSFNVEVRVYDELSAQIIEGVLSKGTPLIDYTQEGIAINNKYDSGEGGALQILGKNILDIMYPVGSIYINAGVSTNPATLMGFGTWVAFGEGEVLVGLDGGDTDFDTLEETGGAKTHTLTEAEMPTHHHDGYGSGGGGSSNLAANYRADNPVPSSQAVQATQDTGGGNSHNNLQPYIVVQMWKRTA